MMKMSAANSASAFCLLTIVACVSAAVLRTHRDGFSVENIDGERHFGYGVAPENPGDVIKLEFYDVDFPKNNCSDLRVEIYSSGYVENSQDLLGTYCDPMELADFVSDSARGFLIFMTSSSNVHQGQLKARFHSNGALKVTHETFHR